MSAKTDTHSLHKRAQALKASGRLEETIIAYQSIVEAAPHDRIAWHNLASALGDAGRPSEAESAAQQAQALGLSAPETWLVRARALSALGRHDEAEHAFEQVLSERPHDVAALRDLAQLTWMRTADRERALSRLYGVLERRPDDLGVCLALAHILSQIGDADGGLQLAQQVEAKAPHSALVLTATANAALAAKRFDVAHDASRRAITLASGDGAAMMAHTQALLALGEARAAADTASFLRQSQPHNQYVIALEATAWRLLGDARYSALYDYTRFVRTYPIDPPSDWTSRTDYIRDVRAALSERHTLCAHPLDQSVKGASSQLAYVEQLGAPALKAWPEAVAGPVRRYLAETALQAGDGTPGRLLSWSVLLRAGGSHTNHVHPAGLASSACHIGVPETLTTGPDGWLKFGEPGVATAEPLHTEYWVRPEPGVIVLFPSYMWHGVASFSGDAPRITIAMDVARSFS